MVGGSGRPRGHHRKGQDRVGQPPSSLVPATLYTEAPDSGRGTTAPPRPRPDRRGARPYPRADGARAEPLRARRLLAPLVGALRLQALRAPAQAVSDRLAPRAPGPGRERR